MDLRFRAETFRCRIHSGPSALDALPADLARLGIRRALVVCGATVSRQTPLIGLIRQLAGERLAGVFDRSGRHASADAVWQTVEMARAVGADGLVAVGAGSVMMSARITAILLAEDRPLEDLVTKYGDEGPAVSPRLAAPKLPIINVLTAPTNAQNRGGSAMRAAGAGRRLEMFDPKTRPASIYWDGRALATAPPTLVRNGSLMLLWWSLLGLAGVPDGNPLSQADRTQSFALAREAFARLGQPGDTDARIAMCAAAFLQNRDEDDGGRPFDVSWVFRVCYALGSGIFTLDDANDPGPVYVALTPAAIEHFGERNLPRLRFMLAALGTVSAEAAGRASAREIADAVRSYFADLGETRRLRDFKLARDQLPAVRDFALRNFNADQRRELRHEVPLLDATLAAAW